MKRAAVLLSGGVDSAVALAILLDQKHDAEITAVFVDYGQRTVAKEAWCAKSLAFRYRATIVKIEVRGLFDKRSALINKEANTPWHWDHTELPYRNATLLSIGASILYTLGGGELWHGINPSSQAGIGYPDTTRLFLDAQATSIHEGTRGRVTLVSPFYSRASKAESIILGEKLGVPWQFTHTCFVSSDEQCGECPSCLDRQKFFKIARIVDTRGYRKDDRVSSDRTDPTSKRVETVS